MTPESPYFTARSVSSRGHDALHDHGQVACRLPQPLQRVPGRRRERRGAGKSPDVQTISSPLYSNSPLPSRGIPPALHQFRDELVMNAAFAVRYVIDIHGNRDAGAALVLQPLGEVHHLVLGAEFGGGGELPPELRPLPDSITLSMPPLVIIIVFESPAP